MVGGGHPHVLFLPPQLRQRFELEIERMKQMHQKDMNQLPMSPLKMPMSATKENATQVDKSCGTRRNQNTLFT